MTDRMVAAIITDEFTQWDVSADTCWVGETINEYLDDLRDSLIKRLEQGKLIERGGQEIGATD